jgi:hypothetical protein
MEVGGKIKFKNGLPLANGATRSKKDPLSLAPPTPYDVNTLYV